MKGFYMHVNAMDAVIKILRTPYSDNKRMRLKVEWWNLGYAGKPYKISATPQNITITASEYAKWKQLTNQQLTTARKVPGFPI